MGTLIYGAGQLAIDMPDRILAHVRVVATAKLRRNEGFLISWMERPGTGHHSVWVHAGTELHYRFEGTSAPAIEDRVLAEMALQAMDARGINLDDPRYAP